MRKIVHVHLIFEKKDLYFGSISAIYDHLSENQVGIKKSYLQSLKLSTGEVKPTKRAIIKVSELLTSSSQKEISN